LLENSQLLENILNQVKISFSYFLQENVTNSMILLVLDATVLLYDINIYIQRTFAQKITQIGKETLRFVTYNSRNAMLLYNYIVQSLV